METKTKLLNDAILMKCDLLLLYCELTANLQKFLKGLCQFADKFEFIRPPTFICNSGKEQQFKQDFLDQLCIKGYFNLPEMKSEDKHLLVNLTKKCQLSRQHNLRKMKSYKRLCKENLMNQKESKEEKEEKTNKKFNGFKRPSLLRIEK